MEKTLIIIKPDAVQRGLVGEITSRLERKGLKLVGMKMTKIDDEVIKDHYAHLSALPVFAGITEFMTSSPVVIQCWEGFEAIDAVRLICGVTNARKASGGTIRGDFAMSNRFNLIHASDSNENAQKEIDRFFGENEIFKYDKSEYLHVYADNER